MTCAPASTSVEARYTPLFILASLPGNGARCQAPIRARAAGRISGRARETVTSPPAVVLPLTACRARPAGAGALVPAREPGGRAECRWVRRKRWLPHPLDSQSSVWHPDRVPPQRSQKIMPIPTVTAAASGGCSTISFWPAMPRHPRGRRIASCTRAAVRPRGPTGSGCRRCALRAPTAPTPRCWDCCLMQPARPRWPTAPG